MLKSGTLIIVALFGALVNGHALVSHIHIAGRAENKCVRIPPNTNPIKDLASVAMACNVGGNVGGLVAGKCAVKAGDTVGFEWRVDLNIPPRDIPEKDTPDGPTPVGVIDDSHKGPCAVYMKKVANAVTATAAGGGWFKIQEEGVVNGVFCIDRIRLANGLHQVKIPKTIENGDYLIRSEFLTLNNAGPASLGGQEEPQFYTGCAQITVTGGTGTGASGEVKVSIPGYINMKTPGMIFDIWNGAYKPYPKFGPKIFVDQAAPSPTRTTLITSTTKKPTTTKKSTTTKKPTTTKKATTTKKTTTTKKSTTTPKPTTTKKPTMTTTKKATTTKASTTKRSTTTKTMTTTTTKTFTIKPTTTKKVTTTKTSTTSCTSKPSRVPRQVRRYVQHAQ